ncbi:hydrocephalus-inducing protein-like [Hydractinia symbiolongicarpus]|uniref:hydrocephalus-inducing protein-like n=1 Tax=Hydractinia symbiolongicarpus TaxID=13093 RepID=UPI00254F1CD1|nr:hydrocephalus-inducing protein-like [Hydractinia symbiolongicarpus]
MPSKNRSRVVAPRNPKLVKGNVDEDKQCPSAFLMEMSLTTQERLDKTYEMHVPEIIELLDMSEMTHQKSTIVDLGSPLFQPYPSEIIFQNFEAQQVYKIPLQLRNNDQVAILVKVVQAESPYFKIISPPDVGHKVAPGMDIIFVIQFTPDQKKDYNHEVICITEREKFLVPVKAIGARGILDFPDEIHFGLCPVKYNLSKTLLVRNIGNTETKFNLLVEEPFKVSPEKGVLDVGKSIQVEVGFNPQQTGGCQSHLIIQYETGEEVFVGLYGDSSDMNVRLDKNTVRLDNTYITSASRRTISLSNRSNFLVHFQWKTCATAIEEDQQRQLYYRELSLKGVEENDAFLEECITDPLMRDKFSLVTQSIKNKIQIAADDQMFYSDENIIVEPIEGDIWPNSSIDINIIFKPEEAKCYSRTAYCDITGRENRLPLRLRGDGIGPNIQFSFDTLDVENVFVRSQHSYEVVIANKGDIDAVFSYVPSNTLFGQQFSFSPSQGIVRAGDHQAVQIIFNSSHLGEFAEYFYWAVEGSLQQFKFKIRGNVIGPTFHFDVPQLKFGVVSYGFCYERTCTLVNTSMVPMTFSLRVPTDGHGVSAADVSTRFLEGLTDIKTVYKQIREKPVEFNLTPSGGVLLPLSGVEIQICFTPLTSGKYDTVITVDIEGIGKDILTLPIAAKCIVPTIGIVSPILDFGRCFIHHTYQRMVELYNDTELPAKYELYKHEEDENALLTYSSPLPRAIIEANSTLEVPLHITLKSVKQINTAVHFTIFGSKQKSLHVNIKAIGDGPVVHLNKQNIVFNQIPVLSDVTECLSLSNESLIPAQFYCEMVRPHSLFQVEPTSGVIAPEGCIQLKVTANVNDNTRFQDKLSINIVNSQIQTVYLSAVGTGTTIITEPSFGPVYTIGPYFSNHTFQQKFRFYNKGRRPQQIYWLTEGFALSKTRRKQEYNAEDMKYRNMPPPEEPAKPIFKLIPNRLSLTPGRYQDVILKGYSKNAQKVKERMVCQAIVGNSTGKETIMVVDIVADFIQPLLEFSENQINFSVIKQPQTVLSKETKHLIARNISMLPIGVVFTVQKPFQLIYADNTEHDQVDITLDVEENITLILQFDPNFVDDSFSRTVESSIEVVYKDHPNMDNILLTGDVYYPNLEFETMEINFESVLNDTEHIQTVKVTNNSPLEVFYSWSFVNHEISFEGKDVDEGLGKDLSDSSDEEKYISMNNILNTGIENSFLPLHIGERPKTSPVVSNTSLRKRPSTAPPIISSDKESRFSRITWSQIQAPPVHVGIEEVFDILPLYGCLKPTESQQFQFSFYGHPHILAEATAVCNVQDGPEYKIHLKGQASLVQYKISQRKIDLDKQLYDQVKCSEVELLNTGKVNFDFVVLNVDIGKEVHPGVVNVQPAQGFIPAGGTAKLLIKFFPGIPEPFSRNFHIRVAHFDPETITVEGIGVFPRITLSLPKEEDSPKYEKLLKEAKENLENNGKNSEIELFDWDIQEEIDRLEVKYFSLDSHESKALKTQSSTLNGRKAKPKLNLINYVLDFGHVVMGDVASQICQLKNAGHFPVSFIVDHRQLVGTGFYVDLDRVKGLPGFPDNEQLDFEVVFNPSSATLSLGPVEAMLPIKVTNGPITNILIKAHVTMPDISLSTEMIEFDNVVCGQCKVITIQLCNITKVRCDWEHQVPQEKNEIEKHLPMHLRKKMKRKVPKAKIFEIMPPHGSLLSGQKMNVQVKFMPMEETSYSEKLFIKVSKSTEKHFVFCKGQGKEPHIEFDKTVLKFGPILPHSGKDDVVVKVTNPCSIPIEFYSLEFDKQYLKEEEILRTLKGYDEYNTILLPPRAPGDPLPKQLLEHYEKVNKTTSDTNVPVTINEMDSTRKVMLSPTKTELEEKVVSVGDLEITPVSAAIATHLGIDLSVEGRAARNRRGMCLIVHGPPLCGKTATARDLAELYGHAYISIDEVVLDALQHGSSSAAIRVGELCAAAARLSKANEELRSHLNNDAKLDADLNGLSTGGMAGMVKYAGQGRKSSMLPPTKNNKLNSHPPAVSPQPPPAVAFLSKKLDVSVTVESSEEEEYYSCVLPDDLLVELLADRMQVSDCHHGLVFDGLETMFTTSLPTALTILLRAINNRKYIYAITLKFGYETLKEHNTTKCKEEELQKQIAEEAELTRLEEMSEDEYDALPETERKLIDEKRLLTKREKLQKRKELKEQQEQERREKEMQDGKRLEDEKGTKKGRKTAPVGGSKIKEKKSSEKLIARESTTNKLTTEATARPDTSLLSERSASVEDTDKKRMSKTRQKSAMHREKQITPIEEQQELYETEEERILHARFKPYEQHLNDVLAILDTWDRTTGTVAISESDKGEIELETPAIPPVPASKKSERKKQDRDRLKEISESPAPSASSVDNSSVPDDNEKVVRDGIGIPNIILNTKLPQASLLTEVLEVGLLPSIEQVMDGVGAGPSGPPIPPEAVFSVVPFPIVRDPPVINEIGQHFTFIPANENDPNAFDENQSKSDLIKEKPVEKKDSKKHKSRIERTPSAITKKGRQSSLAASKMESPPASPDRNSSDKIDTSRSSTELIKHRWTVNPGDSVDLRVAFVSKDLGQFDQTLNFEIVGTKRKYQLFCRGICAFPNISREPRIVFPHRKKFQRPDEIVHKKYILSSETFTFGPLLAGKNRERYREGRYPENMERICISNTSPMDAEITFAYLNDANATTFLLEPSTAFLKPGENQVLTIWAYPKTPGLYEDTIVCCIKENPEPVLFKVSTHGVRPELELDRRIVQFDRVLLHRKETRIIYLRNSTLLPVAWKLNGMENLGDDFSLPVDHGVIEPMNEFGLQMHFRAMKPNNVKKVVRLEVSDAGNVMGLTHAENISVQAEAYDVALDMSFPKGADGGLDFGTLRVGEEAKQTCTVKNKGRYEIAYSFMFEPIESTAVNLHELFSIVPNKGSLIPNDRPTQVQVTFKSKQEFHVKDVPVLKCQIIEPNMGENGEIIASIPVKLSAKSVYSKYSIYPIHDINFGAVLVNTKKTRTFVIENKSDFDFRYSISKVSLALPQAGKGKPILNPLTRTQSRQGSIYSGRSQQIQPQRSRKDSLKGGDSLGLSTGTGAGAVHNNIRLTLGMFTIFPANGVVLPGSSTTITVDMASEIAMVGEEEVTIDISERPPDDHPNGIEYRLFAETCLPKIIGLPGGLSTIFEEHRIVKNLNVFRYHSNELEPGTGVFGEDENKFIFYNVIVGHKAKARFKITNPNKVPCDVVINAKPISNKLVNRISDIFDVQPSRASVQAHSSVFATLTFQPSSMQSYSCIFETIVEGLSASVSKGRSLTFEVQGDGNLPRISVLKPITTNMKGVPAIVFSKLLLGRSQVMSVELKNEGTLSCDVEIKLTDPHQSFVVMQTCVEDVLSEEDVEDSPIYLHATSTKPVSTMFHAEVGEIIQLSVQFSPHVVAKMVADIRLSVVNNPFEDTTIQLFGEGYEEEVTIDNIQVLVEQDELVVDEIFDEETMIVPSDNQIKFGDCAVNKPVPLHFTLTNHLSTDVVRYKFSDVSCLTFQPSCGHLQANCAKDVTATFLSAEPCRLEAVNVPVKISRIELTNDLKKDWNNTKRVIRWVDDESAISTSQQSEQPFPTTRILPKKKIIEVEEEPTHRVIPDSDVNLDLICSANCNYAKYTCQTDRIYFKETYIFQTRVYSFKLKNEGEVSLKYVWDIEAGKYHPPSPEQDEVTVQQRKPSRGSRKGAKYSNTQSRNSGVKTKTPETPKTPRVLTEGYKSPADNEATVEERTTSRIGYTAEGRPASVMTLVYETEGDGLAQGTDCMPFNIEPRYGTVVPGKEVTFTVRFSPLEIIDFDAILSASIANLESTQDKPTIALHGKSILPWCHFELNESDYITDRRNPELRGPNGAAAGSTLDPNTKVLEFLACGTNTNVQRTFSVFNPTNTSYSFLWNQESYDGTLDGVNSNFTCHTPKGVITPGKKFDMKFEYKFESLELTEAFWRFSITEQNISIPFLLVAFGDEPAVSFDRSHINFKQLLVGHTAQQIVYLMNDEEKPFSFNIAESSRHAAGHVASLQVDPMKGVVAPRSKIPIYIVYQPTTEAEVNFNLLCRVKKKTTPLTLNVKAEGFCVNVKLSCEDSTGNEVNLLQKGTNLINFGEVELNEKAVRQLYIENDGQFNLDFNWIITNPSKPRHNKEAWSIDNLPVTIIPESGTVATCSKRRCQLAFCPPCKFTLKNCQLALKIGNGPTFDISVTGSGRSPTLQFSFFSHDFGACFIYRPGLAVQNKNLVITNTGAKEISLECHFVNTSHLEVHATPSIILPGESKEIEIRFYPRESKVYTERIGFEVNGLSMMYVDIRGEGADMKVDVVDPADRKVNLGIVQVNEKVQKTVRIVNNSLAAISFTATVTPFVTALQNPNVLAITPISLISLNPKAKCDVVVHFHPKSRVAKFSEEVILECAGVSQPLFTIVGACQAQEIKLDSEAIPFGSVTLGSSSSRKLMMMNTGDIGSSFSWNVEQIEASFKISPEKGYISPGMEVPFEIVFTPRDVCQDIRCDNVRCLLERGNSLNLVVTGCCVPQMPMKEVVHFNTHVRNRDTKVIVLHNKTNQMWTLKPIIDGEYWSAVETFIVDPQQSKNYEIVYRPLAMTQDQKKHNGSVFFALPDGSGLLYNLIGNSDPPKPVGNIQRDVPCKMAYTEMLNVSNWLRKPQRFRVMMELVKPDKPDPATTFKGFDYIDVPGLSKKEYKLNFYAHREGTFSSKVTFKNEQSGEYQFYYVTFKVGSATTIGSIEMTTPARQSVSHVVTVHNPLVNMVNFQTNCNLQDVNLPPQFIVPPQSDGSCTFEYLPLKAGAVSGRLVLQSLELGAYIYDLNLTATPAASERPVHFVTTLGTSQVQSCRFTSYARTRVEYTCKIDSIEFTVEKSVNAASAASGGSEVNVDVTFEPSVLGDCHGTLTVTSHIGGEYVFPLHGHCLPPKPQGPYTIKAGGSSQIPFKNIFSQNTTFSFLVDNPSFTVKSAETIRAKKTHNIVVSFDGNQGDSKAVRTGRLVVKCARSAGVSGNLTWTFYLKGVTV